MGVAEVEDVFAVEDRAGLVDELGVAGEGDDDGGVVFSGRFVGGELEGAEVVVWFDHSFVMKDVMEDHLTDFVWTAEEVERRVVDVVLVEGCDRVCWDLRVV